MEFANALHQLVAAFRAAELEASVDPTDLNLPGVWVTLDRLTGFTMGRGGMCRARVFLIVGDQDDVRAMEALQDLYGQATAVLPPMSDVESTLARLPGNAPELPALTYTHDIPA